MAKRAGVWYNIDAYAARLSAGAPKARIYIISSAAEKSKMPAGLYTADMTIGSEVSE